MRLFTGELMFASSQLRALGSLSAPQIYHLARTPLRHREESRLRLRLNAIGAFDFGAAYERCSNECQVTSYYLLDPIPAGKALPGTQPFNDVNLRELGGGYERVFPLYPLFDFKLKAGVKWVDRQGVIEFLPYEHEKFFLYEGRTSFSHFVGPD